MALARLGLMVFTQVAAITGCRHSPPGGGRGVAELGADLERLGRRAYSDEGIPVLLVCEDLSSQRRPGRGRGFRDGKESRDMAAWLRALARARGQITPAPAAADVAKLLEVMAHRDLDARLQGASR